MSCSPLSSHASSLLRAMMTVPTPSPPPATKSCHADQLADELEPPALASPRQRPVYKLFGMVSGGSDWSSTTGDSGLGVCIRPLVLPPPSTPHRKPGPRALTRTSTRLDVFGPIPSNIEQLHGFASSGWRPWKLIQ
ncbi:hypothetical protein DFH09DRAFT_1302535 [Mycena vulgaris]|nr:hypothetical protein DFH09DRAFT_1302535 [Mycena vulgaris]